MQYPYHWELEQQHAQYVHDMPRRMRSAFAAGRARGYEERRVEEQHRVLEAAAAERLAAVQTVTQQEYARRQLITAHAQIIYREYSASYLLLNLKRAEESGRAIVWEEFIASSNMHAREFVLTQDFIREIEALAAQTVATMSLLWLGVTAGVLTNLVKNYEQGLDEINAHQEESWAALCLFASTEMELVQQAITLRKELEQQAALKAAEKTAQESAHQVLRSFFEAESIGHFFSLLTSLSVTNRIKLLHDILLWLNTKDFPQDLLANVNVLKNLRIVVGILVLKISSADQEYLANREILNVIHHQAHIFLLKHLYNKTIPQLMRAYGGNYNCLAAGLFLMHELCTVCAVHGLEDKATNFIKELSTALDQVVKLRAPQIANPQYCLAFCALYVYLHLKDAHTDKLTSTDKVILSFFGSAPGMQLLDSVDVFNRKSFEVLIQVLFERAQRSPVFAQAMLRIKIKDISLQEFLIDTAAGYYTVHNGPEGEYSAVLNPNFFEIIQRAIIVFFRTNNVGSKPIIEKKSDLVEMAQIIKCLLIEGRHRQGVVLPAFADEVLAIVSDVHTPNCIIVTRLLLRDTPEIYTALVRVLGTFKECAANRKFQWSTLSLLEELRILSAYVILSTDKTTSLALLLEFMEVVFIPHYANAGHGDIAKYICEQWRLTFTSEYFMELGAVFNQQGKIADFGKFVRILSAAKDKWELDAQADASPKLASKAKFSR